MLDKPTADIIATALADNAITYQAEPQLPDNTPKDVTEEDGEQPALFPLRYDNGEPYDE